MATKAEDLQLGTYKYGWHDQGKPVFEPKRGLSEDVVREISALKDRLTEEKLYLEDEMRFVSVGTAINPGSAPTGASAWLVWPMKLLPYDDPIVESQLRADLMLVAPAIDLDAAGVAVVGVAPSATAAHQLGMSAGIADTATVEAAITRALAPVPTDRQSSIEQFIAELSTRAAPRRLESGSRVSATRNVRGRRSGAPSFGTNRVGCARLVTSTMLPEPPGSSGRTCSASGALSRGVSFRRRTSRLR